MTYYSNGTPDFTTQEDRVRRLLPDVKTGSFLLTSAEIALFATGGQLAQANDYLVAAMCAETIANALMVDMSAGGTSVSLSQQFNHWMKRAASLRAMSARQSSVTPYVGGVSIDKKQTIEDDTDRVAPPFSITLGDPPGGSGTTFDPLEVWP